MSPAGEDLGNAAATAQQGNEILWRKALRTEFATTSSFDLGFRGSRLADLAVWRRGNEESAAHFH